MFKLQAVQFDHYEVVHCMENDVVPDQLTSLEADLDIHPFQSIYLVPYCFQKS